MKIQKVTLLGVDCVDVERLIKAVEICKEHFEFADVKILTSLPSDHPQVVPIEPINSIRAYSEFILKRAADYIDTDLALIVQHDGFILNPEAWSDEFLEYEYVGAPMWEKDKLVVGNGGFNLRSKRLFELTKNDESIQLGDRDEHIFAENEDWIICVKYREYIENKGIRFAPVELAHQFSFESNGKYGKKWAGQFGFHGLKWTDIGAWLKEHPEYGIENPVSHS